jgi:hypothetical protein
VVSYCDTNNPAGAVCPGLGPRWNTTLYVCFISLFPYFPISLFPYFLLSLFPSSPLIIITATRQLRPSNLRRPRANLSRHRSLCVGRALLPHCPPHPLCSHELGSSHLHRCVIEGRRGGGEEEERRRKRRERRGDERI